MNVIAFLLFILTPMRLLGQPAPTPKSHRVSIGLNFSPTLNYRTLSAIEPDSWAIVNRNKQERSNWNYDVGISLSIPFRNRLVVESGFWYVKKGYKTDWQLLNWNSTDPDLPLSSLTRFTYSFVSLPLKIKYPFGRGKLRGFVVGGIALDFFIRQQVDVITNYSDRQSQSSAAKFVGISRFNLVPTFSGGINYSLSTALSLKIEPVFQYFALPLRPGLVVREHLYSSGLTMGLVQRF